MHQATLTLADVLARAAPIRRGIKFEFVAFAVTADVHISSKPNLGRGVDSPAKASKMQVLFYAQCKLKNHKISKIMASRLWKMYLVNAKTSGKVSSGRITELDARGGAAITGPNGVGKTTTLQLLPLFFGHSPNQIAPVGENREPILRFVLPHPESAIAYEYQRGDAPGDVCLVVLRRQPQSDAPEYRFFASPFQKEFFITKDTDGDGDIFLDDAGSAEAATNLGVSPSAKHAAAHYRQVILNNIGVGKDSDARRQEARKYSFSTKRLPHLDRLVAAVVKEHINFADFTEVASNIVTERIGGLNANASGKSPQLKQSKEQIERWLRDRDGADRALKLKPSVEALRDVLINIQQQEILLGQKRADVHRLQRINQQQLDQAKDAINELAQARERDIELATAEQSQLASLTESAMDAVRIASNEYQELRNRKVYFDDSDASTWAQRQQQLTGLKARESSQRALIETLQSAATGIVQTYEAKIERTKTSTSDAVVKMLETKNTPARLFDEEVALLNQQENSAIETLVSRHQPELAEIRNKVERSVNRLADAAAQLARPSVAPEIEERLRNARQVLAEHQDEVIDAQTILGHRTTSRNEARNLRNDLERQVERQKECLRDAEQALRDAHARVQPIAGSLHEALLASPDEQWRTNLARVIDPALLLRTDLLGHMVDEGNSLYGWAMNLDAIATPEWTHRETLEKALESNKRQELAAKTKLVEIEAAFNNAEDARIVAEEAFNQQEAKLNVLTAKTDRLKLHKEACEKGLEAALEAAKARAGHDHDVAKQQLNADRQLYDNCLRAHEKEVANEKATFAAARETAMHRRDTKLREINNSVEAFRHQQASLVKEMELARDRELEAKGVDTDKLNKLLKQLGLLTDEIKEINDHADLVLNWQDWINSHGPTKLVDAETALNRAQKALDTAQTNQAESQKAHTNRLKEFTQREHAQNAAISKANREIATLNEADRLLIDFVKSGVSTLTSDAFASELLAECKVAT